MLLDSFLWNWMLMPKKIDVNTQIILDIFNSALFI